MSEILTSWNEASVIHEVLNPLWGRHHELLWDVLSSPVCITGVSSTVDEMLNILWMLGCEDGPEELAINSLG